LYAESNRNWDILKKLVASTVNTTDMQRVAIRTLKREYRRRGSISSLEHTDGSSLHPRDTDCAYLHPFPPYPGLGWVSCATSALLIQLGRVTLGHRLVRFEKWLGGGWVPA
jgi:hypothetical protein